jgi:hypothetical protein
MFALNNSNVMFAVMTSLHLDFEHFEMPPTMKGLNDAILKRLEINMSDPQTLKATYDTPLKDVIGGGKDLVNSERGRFNIANGIADFINGMAMQMSGKMPPRTDPALTASNQLAPVIPHAPVSKSTTPDTSGSSSTAHGATNGTAASKGDGNPFGPPKPQPPIPAEGPWTPLKMALKEQGPIISAGIKHGAVKSMNAGVDSFKQVFPVYDFYNIYNTGVCWGYYKPSGPQTVGCGSSAEWKDVDMAPRIQSLVNKLVSPTTKIVGPTGLGPNMERFLATMRILLLLMYINKVLTVVNQGLAMALPIIGIVCMFGGCLPPRLHLKLSFINFSTSAAATGMVFGGTMGVLMTLLGMGITMPPMNAMMSIDMKLGINYLMLCLVDTVFAITGTVCWWKIWRMMVNGAKQAEKEKESFSREHGNVEVIEVQQNKPYDA